MCTPGYYVIQFIIHMILVSKDRKHVSKTDQRTIDAAGEASWWGTMTTGMMGTGAASAATTGACFAAAGTGIGLPLAALLVMRGRERSKTPYFEHDLVKETNESLKGVHVHTQPRYDPSRLSVRELKAALRKHGTDWYKLIDKKRPLKADFVELYLQEIVATQLEGGGRRRSKKAGRRSRRR